MKFKVRRLNYFLSVVSISAIAFSCSCNTNTGGDHPDFNQPNIPESYQMNFKSVTDPDNYDAALMNLQINESTRTYNVAPKDMMVDTDAQTAYTPAIGNHVNANVFDVTFLNDQTIHFVVDRNLIADANSGWSNTAFVKTLITTFFQQASWGAGLFNLNTILVNPALGNTITSYTTPGTGIYIAWPFEPVSKTVPLSWRLDTNWTSDYLLSTLNHELAHFEYYQYSTLNHRNAIYDYSSLDAFDQQQYDDLITGYGKVANKEDTLLRLQQAHDGTLANNATTTCSPNTKSCTNLLPTDINTNNSLLHVTAQNQNYEWKAEEYDAREITQLSFLPKYTQNDFTSANAITGYANDYVNQRHYTQETAYGNIKNQKWSDDNWRGALSEEQYWFGSIYGMGWYNDDWSDSSKPTKLLHIGKFDQFETVNKGYFTKHSQGLENDRFGFGWYSSSKNLPATSISMNYGGNPITLTGHIMPLHHFVKQSQNSTNIVMYNKNKYLIYYQDDSITPTTIIPDGSQSQITFVGGNITLPDSSQLTNQISIKKNGSNYYIHF